MYQIPRQQLQQQQHQQQYLASSSSSSPQFPSPYLAPSGNHVTSTMMTTLVNGDWIDLPHAILPLCPATEVNCCVTIQHPHSYSHSIPHSNPPRFSHPPPSHTPPAYCYRVRGPHPGISGLPPAFIPQPVTVPLESRIYEMNKRIQNRSEDPDQASLWWDAFGQEFFDDDAQLTLRFSLDDGPKRYTIGRTLIPRYFRSIFDGGVKDLYYLLRAPSREFSPAPGIAVLECTVLMVTVHDKPVTAANDKKLSTEMSQVHTVGHLLVEFTFDEPYMPRIRQWIMDIQNHDEFISKRLLSDPAYHQEQLSSNVTRQGMTSVTLNYLRLCVILEPMQQLMSLHKTYNEPPRDCLRRTLFQRFQSTPSLQQQRGPPPMSQPIIIQEAEPARPTKTRKRNRKGSQSGGTTPTGGGGKKKNAVSPAPAPTSFPLASHVDVMVVGEPSMMGGEYGEEDERMISRMENTQFDTASGALIAAPPSGPDTQGGPPPFETGLPWGAGAVAQLRGGGSRTPQTPGSRTGTPLASGVGAIESPIQGNGRRSVKSEVAPPDNGLP